MKPSASQFQSQTFSQQLLNWYDIYGRKTLPWRRSITPYRIWVSEIMLQQTQVATVIPYFETFLKRFPSITELATSSIDEVLCLWAGLGYYARARNLHRTAQLIATQFEGKFPDDIETLQKLPGIGRSTAGAICALAFGQRAPILDGNVKRIFTRLRVIAGWPGKPEIAKQLWKVASELLPKNRCNDYTQALMDLGALICTKTKPNCDRCPVTEKCLAYQTEQVGLLPTPKPKKILPTFQAYVLIIENNEQAILLQQRPPTGIWGGLWSLPQCSKEEDISLWCRQHLGLNIDIIKQLDLIRHTFTHFHQELIPVKLKLKQLYPSSIPMGIDHYVVMDSSKQVWYKLGQPIALGLPAPIKRLLESTRWR